MQVLRSTSIRVAPKSAELKCIRSRQTLLPIQRPAPSPDHLPFRSTMVRIYGILISNLPPTTEPLAVQLFFEGHQLHPYELQVRSHLTSEKHKLVERSQACVHFLSKSEKDHAMLMAHGAKFGNHIIKAKSCLCEKPFAGDNTKNSTEKIRTPPMKHQDRDKKTTLTIPYAIRMNRNRIVSKNPFYFESQGRKHFAPLHPSAYGNSDTSFPESSRSSRVRELARLRSDAQRFDVKMNHFSPQCNTKHIPIWNRTKESEFSYTLADSHKEHTNVRGTDSRPVSRPTTKIHGVKVSNLHYTTTTKEVKEHFESRNFTIAEVAVHRRNRQDTIACVHLHNEEDQLLAIRKTNGSLLYGRKITVEPCCCRRTLREEGYGKRQFLKASNDSANKSCQCVKCTSASDSSRIEKGGSQAFSSVPMPNSDAPTVNITPASTMATGNSNAPTVRTTLAPALKAAKSEAPTVSINPASTVAAVTCEAPTLSSTPISHVPDTNFSCIVGSGKSKVQVKRNDQLEEPPGPTVATESTISSANPTNLAPSCLTNSRPSSEATISPSASKALSTAPFCNDTKAEAHARLTGTAASSMPLFIAFPFHGLNTTPSFRRENTITLSGEFPLCRCTQRCRFQSGACRTKQSTGSTKRECACGCGGGVECCLNALMSYIVKMNSVGKK